MAVKNTEAGAFYETEALRNGWSVRQLERQINSQFYEWIALSRSRAAMLKKGSAVTRTPGLL
jgi:predicted nuclease of restriction endonuclease-like (RecB) superfamily